MVTKSKLLALLLSLIAPLVLSDNVRKPVLLSDDDKIDSGIVISPIPNPIPQGLVIYHQDESKSDQIGASLKAAIYVDDDYRYDSFLVEF